MPILHYDILRNTNQIKFYFWHNPYQIFAVVEHNSDGFRREKIHRSLAKINAERLRRPNWLCAAVSFAVLAIRTKGIFVHFFPNRFLGDEIFIVAGAVVNFAFLAKHNLLMKACPAAFRTAAFLHVWDGCCRRHLVNRSTNPQAS